MLNVASLKSGSLRGKRIVVIEDDPILAYDYVDLLEREGAIALGPVHNLEKALEICRAEPCDAAVLDINLGDQDVWEAAEVLKKRGTHIVFISAICNRSMLPLSFASYQCIEKPAADARIIGALSCGLSG